MTLNAALGPSIESLKTSASRMRSLAAATTATWNDSQRRRFDDRYTTPMLNEIARVTREFERIQDDVTRAQELLRSSRR